MDKIKQLPKGSAQNPSRLSPPASSSTFYVADPCPFSMETPAVEPNILDTLPVKHRHLLSSASPSDARANQTSNMLVAVADDRAQTQALPPNLLAVSQVRMSLYILFLYYVQFHV